MKVLVALGFLFAVSNALTVSQTNWYSGSVNTTGTPQANAVNTGVSPCAVLTTATGYRNFTLNVTSAGFYYFSALFEKPFISSAQIQVYNAPFNPALACSNLVIAASSGSGVPHLEFVLYLGVGFYPVVITGSNPSNLGLFAVHVDAMNFNAATNVLTSNYWYAPDGTTSCSDSSYPGTYATHSWQQTETVSADFLFFAYNSTATSSWYFAAAIYNSSALPLLTVGNSTNPTSACNANYVSGVYNGNSALNFNLQNAGSTYQAAALLSISLVSGLNYTIAIGTYDSTIFAASFGFWMRPTALGALGTLLFTAPVIPAYSVVDTCTSGDDKYFASSYFTADYNAYILDNPSFDFDTAGCLYFGNNLGSSTVPPMTCPATFISCGDTGDGGPVANFLIPGNNYTWVQIPYSYPGTSGNRFLLYNYSGKLLGSAPVSTTAAPGVTTGGNGGSATVTTGSNGSGSAGVTTGHTVSGSGQSTTGMNEGSHSSASSVVAFAALTIVALLF